jgi:hypothetical protein
MARREKKDCRISMLLLFLKQKKILKAKYNLLLSILIEREQISPPSSPCN